MPIITLENVNKSFSSLKVLKDISFSLEKGEVLSIIGPSGSGKSTLLRCITNLEKIDSGTIKIGDDTLATTNEKEEVVYANKQTLARIRLRVGLVFQNFNLFPHFSVLRNITEAQMHVLKASKEEAAEIAYQLLKKMDLSSKAHSYPYQLSGGQQQRVSIARALALKPDVLCFDEPTSALDPELTGEILTVIKELAQENMTMMVVTHEMAFARDISKSVIFMDDGVIIEKGTPESIFNNSTNKRTAKFLSRFSN
ncbi:MAG: amino acid ABC transporter ATP-binding protein [Sphaerochaetaceae bacterium]